MTIVVDVLRFSTTVAARVADGDRVPLDDAAHAVSLNGAAVAAEAAASPGTLVILGALTNPAAVAAAVMAEQERRGGRTSIAVIAAGERVADRQSEQVRFAVEDFFGAGAVIDALAAVGIDHSSPEAAAAGEAFRGLRGAIRHLLTASGSGQELIERGLRDEVVAATAIDSISVAPALRDGYFVG